MKKNRDTLLQIQNDTYIKFRELRRSFAELENKLKEMEEKSKTIDSGINYYFEGRNIFQTTQEKLSHKQN